MTAPSLERPAAHPVRALKSIKALRADRVLFALVASICLGAPAAQAQPQPKPASLDLTKLRGKVVYLDFWASWCGPCKLSFPYMQRLAAAHPADQFVIVAVNVDRSRDSADAFLAQAKSRLQIVYDPSAELARKFAVKGMPTSMLIGRDGRVRYVHEGFFPAKIPAYEAQITELLNEKP